MPSSFRIPKATLRGPYMTVLKAATTRLLGQTPDSLYMIGHHRRALWASLSFENKVRRWKALDPELKSYATLASAAYVSCSWCLDFGSFHAEKTGLDPAKLREVPRWRESSVFSELERLVMAYAEAMTATPLTVTDEMVAELDRQLGHEAFVELTMIVAIENERSRFNVALGLASQGFSDVCRLPADPMSEPERMVG